MLSHSVVFEHMQQRCFASIVKSQEDEFSRFFVESQVVKNSSEVIPEKRHDELLSSCLYNELRKIKKSRSGRVNERNRGFVYDSVASQYEKG